MTKHTPGPWILRSAGEILHGVPHPFDFVEVSKLRYVTAEGKSEREANANARLIAAAPDMLNALLDVLDFWDDPNMSMSELKERVRDAIAKAQGEG
jgi:hypothetical protein